MELADFRRAWQQPPAEAAPAPTPLTDQTLLSMLTRQPNSPVAIMKANARRDVRVGLAVILLNFINLYNLLKSRGTESNAHLELGLIGAFTLVAVLFLAWSIRVKQRLLASMEADTVNLREHLTRLVKQFRQLLRGGARVGLVLGVGIVGLFTFARRQELLDYLAPGAAERASHVLLALLFVGAVFALFAFAYQRGQTLRQRRYGRYLDQLEAALRELDEPTMPLAPAAIQP